MSAGSKNAGRVAAFSSVFSQESSATISSYLSSGTPSTLRSDRSRPPSYARAHSPAPLVLSPGIYNTLCFPSAICLGFSAPSLTLLSCVLFLFNSAVSSPPSLRVPVIYPSRTLTSERVIERERDNLHNFLRLNITRYSKALAYNGGTLSIRNRN